MTAFENEVEKNRSILKWSEEIQKQQLRKTLLIALAFSCIDNEWYMLKMMKTENDTVISVISNLRIDSTLVNEYLPFVHFFSFFFIRMLYLLHSLVKYICMPIYSRVLVYQEIMSSS